MSCKSLLVLGALMLATMQATAAPINVVGVMPPANLMNEAPRPPEQKTYTMTIYNGPKVSQKTFVWENGAWAEVRFDVYFRDCPREPWQYYGAYSSPRNAEVAACSLRTTGIQVDVRPHCS
jgi:hypothetical protein